MSKNFTSKHSAGITQHTASTSWLRFIVTVRTHNIMYSSVHLVARLLYNTTSYELCMLRTGCMCAPQINSTHDTYTYMYSHRTSLDHHQSCCAAYIMASVTELQSSLVNNFKTWRDHRHVHVQSSSLLKILGVSHRPT